MKQAIVIAGPTASGKSALALELAQHFRTEIISADSRQFYREMNIGTAKPEERDLNLIPHHLINTLNVTENYNAGLFETEALEIAEQLFQKHDIIFLCGGSGLYIDAFCKGIDVLPDTEPEIREELNRIYKTEGIESLQKKLKDADPEYFSEMDTKNPHRLIRALEVISIAGKKFSEMRQQKPAERNFRIKKIGLLLDRDDLYERINKRVDEMMKNGLLDEVRSLLPYRHTNALQTVGYKELFDYLDDKISLEEAVALIKQNTRNYAKRQMTWFRKDPSVKWFYPDEKTSILSFILNQLMS